MGLNLTQNTLHDAPHSQHTTFITKFRLGLTGKH